MPSLGKDRIRFAGTRYEFTPLESKTQFGRLVSTCGLHLQREWPCERNESRGTSRLTSGRNHPFVGLEGHGSGSDPVRPRIHDSDNTMDPDRL